MTTVIGRGKGRGSQKECLNEFKPKTCTVKPEDITSNDVTKGQFTDPDEELLSWITDSNLNTHTIDELSEKIAEDILNDERPQETTENTSSQVLEIENNSDVKFVQNAKDDTSTTTTTHNISEEEKGVIDTTSSNTVTLVQDEKPTIQFDSVLLNAVNAAEFKHVS